MRSTPVLDVKNLCSRKLWEILQSEQSQPLDLEQKNTVIKELIMRRHYIKELAKLNQQIH